MANPETPVPAGDFARDTEVHPDPAVPGRFHADLPEAWKVFYAFGGCSMAVALRAAQTAVARDDLHPVSATATFVSPVPCGPLVIDTQVLRSGRTAAQAVATLRAAGSDTPGVQLTAIFGDVHDSMVSFVDAEWPADALSVEDSPDPPVTPESSPFHSINYHQQTDFRPGTKGGGLFVADNWEPGPARSLSWHRLLKEPRLPDGTLDPIAYCVPADILGPGIFAKLGPPGDDLPFFIVLSLEISVQFLERTDSAWLLQHNRIPHAGDGYASSTVELWDTDRRLVALANQRANVRPVSRDRFAPDGTA